VPSVLSSSGVSLRRRVRAIPRTDFLVGIIFAVCCIVTFPRPLVIAQVGLDPAWMLGLHVAVSDGMIFGRDVLFTYGPLGFVFFPMYVTQGLWLTSVIFEAVVHVAFYAALLVLVLNRERRLVDGAVLALTGTLIGAFLDVYVVSAVLLVLAILVMDGRHHEWFVIISGTTAVCMFLKFDVGLATLSIMLLGVAWLFFKKERRLALVSFGAWLFAFLVVGLLLMKSGDAFSSFLIGSVQLAAGFGPAMAKDGPLWQLAVGAVGVVAVLIYLLRQILYRAGPTTLWLSVGFLFLSYKEGIVRQDLHILTLYGACALFLGLAYSVERRKPWRLAFLFLIVLLLGSGIRASQFGTGRLTYLKSVYAPENVFQTVNLGLNEDVPGQIFANSVEQLRAYYALSPATLGILTNRTVDVFPWENSIAYAYGFRWDPRPIFQSYSAYTTYLDDDNAEHFTNQNAPDYVLFRTASIDGQTLSIDGRYSLFDEPLTFQALICNYKPIRSDGAYIILQRTGNHCSAPIQLEHVNSDFGTTIDVPVANGYVFAHVYLKYNLLGSIENVFYKGPLVYIRLNFADGSNGTYRFVWDNAGDGLAVGSVPDQLFAAIINRVASFSIWTSQPSVFDNTITVVFTEVTELSSPGSTLSTASLEAVGCHVPSTQASPPAGASIELGYATSDYQRFGTEDT